LTPKQSASLVASVLIVAGTSPLLMASAPIIGLASAQSGITLDDSKVSGTATLFEGSKIMADGYSRLHLNNGTRLDLAAGSHAQIFASHVSLESGQGEFEGASGYEIDARSLKIQLSEKASIARVKIDARDTRVYVTALNAPVNVLNSQGLLVAKVTPGIPFSFLPQGAAAANSYDQTGCVLQKNGAAILTDDGGSQIAELRGSDIRKAIGKRTHVLGSVDATATPSAGASQVVNVTKATLVAKSTGCSALAAKLGATTSPTGLGAAATTGAGSNAAAAAGAGIGAKSAVIIGVAAAAAVGLGGAAAAGVWTTPSP
jgi:hypothetical protein